MAKDKEMGEREREREREKWETIMMTIALVCNLWVFVLKYEIKLTMGKHNHPNTTI